MIRLIRFGTTDLEYVNQLDNIGSGPTPTNYAPLSDGGAIDRFGDQQKSPGAVERIKSTRLIGSTPDAVEDLYFGLLALRGKRDRLYRRTGRGDYHWVYARLVEVMATRDYQRARFKRIQDVDLRFTCQEANWNGAYHGPWLLDSGYYLDSGEDLDTAEEFALTSSPTTIDIALGASSDPGRAPARAITILVDPGDAQITAITIARTGGETLVYTGAVPVGGQLSINCGTMQVTCTGASNAYNNLAFTAAADLAAWFTLQPGDNEIIVTYTGGGSGASIEFRFREVWY